MQWGGDLPADDTVRKPSYEAFQNDENDVRSSGAMAAIGARA